VDHRGRIAMYGSLLIIALLVMGVSHAGKSSGGATKQKAECSDRIDNDGDGFIDLADPGCDSRNDNNEYNPPAIICGDGVCNTVESCSSCAVDCGQCDSCTDYDNGWVPEVPSFVSGYADGSSYNIADQCLDMTTLAEQYCVGAQAFSGTISCGSGGNATTNATTMCSNGACV